MNVSVPLDLARNTILPYLEPELDRLGGFGKVEGLPEARNIIDDTTKFIFYNQQDEKIAFVLCAYTEFSDLPIRNLEKSINIKKSISKELSSVILDPIVYGVQEGMGFVVWPFCQPLENNFLQRKFQHIRIKPHVFNWLKQATESTLKKASEEDKFSSFIYPLQRLKNHKKINDKIKSEIEWQLASLEEESWIPFFVMAHNDLWTNNLLIDEKNRLNEFSGLTIIDWAGAQVRSFAVYDLVRLSMSFRVSRTAFREQLQAHCNILNCSERNALGYLLASLAYLAENLDQFPEERFISLATSCFDYLFSRINLLKL